MPHHIAAAALYMLSKYYDHKYLLASLYIRGIELTQIPVSMMQVIDNYVNWTKEEESQLEFNVDKLV